MRSRVLMIDVGITAHSVMLLPTRHPCTIMSVSGHLGCSCTAFLIHHRQPLHLILHLYQYLTARLSKHSRDLHYHELASIVIQNFALYSMAASHGSSNKTGYKAYIRVYSTEVRYD